MCGNSWNTYGFTILSKFEEKKSHGLWMGIFNKSTAESIHADFDKEWEKYKVKSISSDSYVHNLQSAVVAYNSNHL